MTGDRGEAAGAAKFAAQLAPTRWEETMTDIIRYENLTFPEVDALPRDIPIVIPLGEMTDADLIKRVQRHIAISLSTRSDLRVPQCAVRL